MRRSRRARILKLERLFCEDNGANRSARARLELDFPAEFSRGSCMKIGKTLLHRMKTFSVGHDTLKIANELFLDELELIHVIGEFQDETRKYKQ